MTGCGYAAPNVAIISRLEDAMRRGDTRVTSDTLAPDTIHPGVRPDWICAGRDQILTNARRRAVTRPAVEAIELVASGDHGVMPVKAAGVGAWDGDRRDQALVVFALPDGTMIRTQDYRHR